MSTEEHPSSSPAPARSPVPKPRRRGKTFVLILLLAVMGAALAWYVRSQIDVATDNAYVVGNITPISAEVSGIIVALYVDDNMIVQAGDPVAQIDPVPFQFEVDQALADLRQARFEAAGAEINVRLIRQDRTNLLTGVEARRDESQQALKAAAIEVQTRERIHQKEQEALASLKSQLPGLEAVVVNTHDLYDRFNRLAASGDVPVQDRDNRQAAYLEALARRDALKNTIAGGERQVMASELQLREAEVKHQQSRKFLANAEATVGQAEAAQLQPGIASASAQSLQNKVLQAEAKLRLARLNLSNTLVRAPQGGIISRRTLQLGQTVTARQPFLSIVPLDLDNVWVIANLREEQMAQARVGQAATIYIDAIPQRHFAGWVESVAGGTGSVFSIFPPDNATGNFVRVVQRLPVRVRFADKENFQNMIRPGLSCRVHIDTARIVRQSEHDW